MPLVDVITKVVARARRFAGKGLGEQNTKATMVEPILAALGWEVEDPDEVHREYRPTGRDSPVDYALKLDHSPRLFVEAKGLGEPLSDRRWVAQVIKYASVAGVEWCVLTDGDDFRFYNAAALVDAEEKMFCRVRLTETTPESAARTLTLLSRANLEQNRLEALWTSHFVDRRVTAGLKALLSEPAKSVVGLLRRRVPKLTTKAITDSLRRLDIRIDFPAVALPEPGVAVPRAAKKSKAALGTPKPKTPSLADLIGAGLVDPPARLWCRYKKKDLEATILANGRVEFQGQTYDSCSMAAEIAKATVVGKRMNTNGWDFWRADGAGGKSVPLARVREQFLRAGTNRKPGA